jgi:plasmid stabilization system protein ParE
MRLRITHHAIDNLEEILFYLEFVEYSPITARRTKVKILKTIKDNILRNPFAFRECQEISTKGKIYRRAFCHPYLIIYKIKPFEIVILAIIHTSQSPSRLKALRRVK